MDKDIGKLKGLHLILEAVKQYHRPFIAIAFSTIICIVFYKCLIQDLACNAGEKSIIREILWIMASYLGIYSVGRTGEKIAQTTQKNKQTSTALNESLDINIDEI